jgi:GNAT superfamily N-acetyltransferase
VTWHWKIYELCDDKQRIDVTLVHSWLRTTYWACDRTLATSEIAFANSVCFGLFASGQLVGFCRAVTDHATFAWIADVYIESTHRAQGLGKWMIKCVLAHPALQTRTQWLATRDAHGLYENFGFARHEGMRRGEPPGVGSQEAGGRSQESGVE